jgi:hypothetical protein
MEKRGQLEWMTDGPSVGRSPVGICNLIIRVGRVLVVCRISGSGIRNAEERLSSRAPELQRGSGENYPLSVAVRRAALVRRAYFSGEEKSNQQL